MEIIAEDLQPISFVEDVGFKKVVRFLDSRYLEHIPSRRTLSRKIMPELNTSIKNKIKIVFNATSYVAITTDICTSINTESFLTVTAHTYDKDYVLKTFILTTEKLDRNHTAQYIYEVLTKVFEEWEINNKIGAIVTDSGANIKAAIKKFNGVPYIPCTAHKLNLVVTQAFQNQRVTNEVIAVNDGLHDLNVLLKNVVQL